MIKIHWWEDAQGRYTCHKNDRGLSFKESFLGELKRGSGAPETWYFIIANTDDVVGPFKHMGAARRALEAAVGGEPITTWD